MVRLQPGERHLVRGGGGQDEGGRGRNVDLRLQVRRYLCRYCRLWIWIIIVERSHEINFKNLNEFTEPGITKGRDWFFNFWGAPMIS